MDTMRNIILKFDEEMFYKFKLDKAKKQQKQMQLITWEDYFVELFGFQEKQEK